MKQDKLFEECLSKVDPEVREYVRIQMDYQLMGLPTDEEIYAQFGDGVEYPNDVVCAAKWMRDIAAQKLKEQRAIDDAQIKELKSIVELTASVMGIGTKWFSDVARMDAVMELREKIMKYYD